MQPSERPDVPKSLLLIPGTLVYLGGFDSGTQGLVVEAVVGYQVRTVVAATDEKKSIGNWPKLLQQRRLRISPN